MVDIESMLIALKNSNGANLQGELSHVIRQLQACSLTPGKIRNLFTHTHTPTHMHTPTMFFITALKFCVCC